MRHQLRRVSKRVREARNSCSSGKSRYRSKDEATQHVHKIVSISEDTDHIPVRAYQCGKCRGWHLTSEEPNAPVPFGLFVDGDGI
jgi:hypothetical protein